MKKKQAVFFSLTFLLLILSFGTVCSAGWQTKQGKTRYYVSSTKSYVKSAWKKISKKWYYFDKKGYLKTGRFCVKGKYYYVTRSGGKQINKKIGSYYYGADGAMVKNCWRNVGKYRFYFGANGKAKVGQFTLKKYTYYCDKTTGRVTNRRVGDYYYNRAGVMIKNRWEGAYYYGKTGKAVYGKFTVKGKTYCCLKKTGKVTNRWYNKNFYDEDGVMATNKWIGYGDNKAYVNAAGVITKGNKNPKDPPSEDDIRLLAALVYLEAGNQSYKGKVAVASVVINRVESDRFPDTLKEVIYQSGQFDPVVYGTLDTLYNSKKKIQSESTKAAKEVLNEGSKLEGYYFFNIWWGSLKIGDHYFS